MIGYELIKEFYKYNEGTKRDQKFTLGVAYMQEKQMLSKADFLIHIQALQTVLNDIDRAEYEQIKSGWKVGN